MTKWIKCRDGGALLNVAQIAGIFIDRDYEYRYRRMNQRTSETRYMYRVYADLISTKWNGDVGSAAQCDSIDLRTACTWDAAITTVAALERQLDNDEIRIIDMDQIDRELKKEARV